MSTGKTYSTKYIIDNDGNKGAAGQILTSTDTGINFQDAEKNGPNQIKGAIFNSKEVLMDTPNGGQQVCRVITDEHGEWIQVGRFQANAGTAIRGTWGSVTGLSTSEAQSATTAFSADFGDCYPEEVRVLGSTDFKNWSNSKTVDFIYKVPKGRKWKNFFSGGADNGMTYGGAFSTNNAANRYGMSISGSYDGRGRWHNKTQNFVGMSDVNPTNPSAAYTTATANAFDWGTAGSDAKLSVHATEHYSGQDGKITSGFGEDDNNAFFMDLYPLESNNLVGSNSEYSSAVWILIKLPGGTSGNGGGSGTYWAENGADIHNTNSGNVGIGTSAPATKFSVDTGESTFNRGNSDGTIATFRGKNNVKAVIGTLDSYFVGNVGIGATTPDAKLEVGGGSTGIILSNLGDSSAYDAIRMTYTGYNSGTPEFIFQPKTAPGSGTANTYFRFKTQGSSPGINVANVTVDGRIGIGNLTPQAPLSFATDVGQKIDFYHNTASSDRYGIEVQSSELRIHSGAQGDSTGGITFGKKTTTAFTETMRIRNDGRVGIGTSIPASVLHVHGGSGGASMIIRGDQPTGAYYYGYMYDGTNLKGTTQTNIFYAGATIAADTTIADYAGLRIDAPNVSASNAVITNNYGIYQASSLQKNYFGGSVGIGSTSPSKKLNVEGSVQLGRNGNNTAGDPHITLISGHGIEDASTGNYYGSYGFLEFNANTNYTGSARRFALTNGFLANKFAILRSDTNMATMELSTAGAEPSGAVADFVINTDGKIGIGTTNPSEQLEVDGILQIKRSGDHPAIRFQEDSTTLAYMGSGDWAINGLSNGDFGISSASTGSLALGTNSGSGRMYLIDGGKVGIGAPAPLAVLDISNTASSIYQQWSYDNPGANNYNLQLTETVTSGNVRFVFDQKNAGTVYSDVLVFNQGEIGMGTDEPDGKLNISKGTASGISNLLVLTNHQYADADDSGSSIRFQGYSLFNPGSSNPRYSEIIGVNGGNSVPKRIDFKFYADTDIKTPLSILQSGRVGIGTTSPANLVELKSDSGGTILRLRNADGSLTAAGSVQNSIVMNGRYWSGAGSDFVETRINSVHQLANGNGGSALTFMTQTGGSAPTEKVRIDREGKVGIGTNSPGRKLTVTGDVSGDANNLLLVNENDTDGDSASIGFSMLSNNTYVKSGIFFKRTTTQGRGDLIFANNNEVNGNNVTLSDAKITIQPGGNVGIGQTNPADGLLQVSQNSSQWMGYFYNTSTSGIGAHIETNSSGTQQVLRVSSIFGGSNNAGFRVLANGNAYFGRNSSAPSQELSNSATPTNFGKYTSEIRLIKTPNGGLQKCRVITDNYGEWILVGRFEANAMTSIQGTWSSVSGLSTSTSQNTTTEFSADFGDSYPTEVRIMGATDFTKWRDTRTIDFVYGVPAARKWKYFFSGGADSGMASVGPNHSGNNKFGWTINGSYDGFGRWINPSQTSVGMSDGNVTNPSAAYTTATSNAFTWESAQDAKITVSATRTFSGQDSYEHAGFGNDDNIQGFFDEYPTETNNMQGGQDFSSAVWVLIKLPKSDSGGGSEGPYLPLTAGSTYQLSGELFINAAAGVNVQGTSNDLYFLQGKRTGNSGPTFSVYDNASTAYLNSYQSMTFRANQHGGSGGNFAFTGGNVGIGTSSPSTGLYIEGDSANWNTTTQGPSLGTIHLDPGVGTDHFGNAITFGASDAGAGGSAQAGIYVRSDGSYGTKMYFATTNSYAAGSKTAMWLDHNGTLRVTADIVAYYSSDKRFKDNLVKINNPLVKINKLSGYYFNWNDKQDTYEKGSKDIGIIAQEIEEVLPEIVQTRENGYKAVKYEKIVALLIEGIKEQQQTIEKLEDRLKKLESK